VTILMGVGPMEVLAPCICVWRVAVCLDTFLAHVQRSLEEGGVSMLVLLSCPTPDTEGQRPPASSPGMWGCSPGLARVLSSGFMKATQQMNHCRKGPPWWREQGSPGRVWSQTLI
jgi:hypothetical protein